MKRFLKNLFRGMGSIGEGMSTFTLFPPPMKRIDLPKSDEEAFREDGEKIRSDWQKVIRW